MQRKNKAKMRVAIAGYGAIGKSVAAHLLQGIPGLALVAVGVRNHDAARALLPDHVAVTEIGALADLADIVIECAPAAMLGAIAEPALRAGRSVVVLSCGALLERTELIDLAQAHGGRILVPSGALLGLDAVIAAAEGTIGSVRMTTRKPPGGLAGAPHLFRHGISVDGLTEAKLVFEGTAREAALGFPANVNVAAALSLAGIGADRTQIAIWADPAMTRNVHRIEVEADSARFTVQIENVPSDNPRTGRITALSVVALLRKMGSIIAIGT
jgi:aspartate dehydrogenase